MASSTIGIVTGANKGIGLAIVKQLALQYPASKARNGSLLLYLTARDKSRGEAALAALNDDDALRLKKVLSRDGGLTDVKFHPLDITDSTSIKTFADVVKGAHPDGIDFLVNNAGVALDGFDADTVRDTLACNYFGTLEMSRVFLPLMKPSGRIVQLASMAGHLGGYNEALKTRFRNPTKVVDTTALMDEFVDAVARGRESDEGWPSNGYRVSKAGVIGQTIGLAKEFQAEGSTVDLTCCCPGMVKTEMTNGRGSKTVDQGAQTPVILALNGSEGKSGSFWTDEKLAKW